MKFAGAVLVIVGFIVWFGGDLVGLPAAINLCGLLLLVLGAVLYFIGRRRGRVNKP